MPSRAPRSRRPAVRAQPLPWRLARRGLRGRGRARPPGRELRPVKVRNESLGVEAVEVLRILNLAPGREPRHGDVAGSRTGRTSKVLRPGDTGPQVTLPAADLDRFMARWEASNRQVAVDVLGDPGGRAVPDAAPDVRHHDRAAARPGRLDHYLELLEIPEGSTHRSSGSPSARRREPPLTNERLDGRADLSRKRGHRARGVGVVDVDVDEAALGCGERAVAVGVALEDVHR